MSEIKVVTDEKKVLKASVWYLISNILVRGIGFLTTPIFTRLMSQYEYGQYNAILSWSSILLVICTLDLATSVARAKYEFYEEINEYLSSILILSNISTTVFYIVVEINADFFIKFFGMDMLYIRILFIYFLFFPSFDFLRAKQRIYGEYKGATILSLAGTAASTLASVALVCLMQDRLFGRAIGQFGAFIIIGGFLWNFILLRGRSFKWKYCKYALTISVPLIVHNLSGMLLSNSDRIIIKELCGEEQVALYSLAYTVAMVTSIVLSSLNQAWNPWLFDSLYLNCSEKVRKYSSLYTYLFLAAMIGIMMIVPEIVLIMGGKNYYEARFVMAPVIAGVMFQFVYTMYVNIELYLKRTIEISVGTMIAAIINIALNYLLIPVYGYIAAAYTTLIGYAVLAVIHFAVVEKDGRYKEFYMKKTFLISLVIIILVMLLCLWLYNHTVLRCIILGFYCLNLGILTLKNQKKIQTIICRRKE